MASKRSANHEEDDEPTSKPEQPKTSPDDWINTVLKRSECSDLFSSSTVDIERGQRLIQEIAHNLLLNCQLMIMDKPHRFVEIEAYVNAPAHPDIFTHGDDFQKLFGNWYFHRSGKSYKGGTYKGLDISFGQHGSPAGFLIRSIAPEDSNDVIEGPCCVVDHILSVAKATSIDTFLAKNFPIHPNVWTPSALYIAPIKTQAAHVYRSARVGLTLKKATKTSRHLDFVLSHYRFFTKPTLKKGRVYAILALSKEGKSAAEIAKLVGSPIATVTKYITSSKGEAKEPHTFIGSAMDPDDIAKLYATHSSTATATASTSN